MDNQRTNAAKKYPDFFRVFLPEIHPERMLIPDAFVKMARQQGWEPRDLILKNSSGRVWEVKAFPIDDQLYFDDGWKQFRKDNCLEAMDFVYFTHVGNNVLKFKICEQSTGCEKTKVDDHEEQEKERDNVMDLDEEEEVQQQQQQDEGGDEYDPFGDDSDEEEEEEEVEDEEHEQDEDDDDDDYDPGEDDFDDDEEEEEEEEDEEHNLTKRRKTHPKVFKFNCKREIGSSSVTRIEDAAMYIHHDHPYFIVKQLKGRKNELHIPHAIIKDHSLRFANKIALVCCQCQNIQRNELQKYHRSLPRKIPVNKKHTEEGEFSMWKDGRVRIKGWLAFCKKNKIKENDACICEIMLREDRAIKMFRVHVARKR